MKEIFSEENPCDYDSEKLLTYFEEAIEDSTHYYNYGNLKLLKDIKNMRDEILSRMVDNKNCQMNEFSIE